MPERPSVYSILIPYSSDSLFAYTQTSRFPKPDKHTNNAGNRSCRIIALTKKQSNQCPGRQGNKRGYGEVEVYGW